MTKADDKDTGDENAGSGLPTDEEREAHDEGRERTTEEDSIAAADASSDSDSDDEDSDDEDSDNEYDDSDDEYDDEDEDGDEARTARAAAAASAQPPDRTPMLAAGAVALGVAVVAGLWWSGRDDTTEEELPSVASDELGETPGEPNTEPPQDGPPNPLGQAPMAQQRPQPMPAPPDVAAPPEGAERTASGLAWRVLEEGSGSEHPGEEDIVTLDYTGWTTEGQMVDSTEMRGEPATLPLNRAVEGWQEGVQLMVAGEKRRFWVPAELADTGRGAPPGPIVFDMELVSFRTAPEPPPTPRNVAAPPADAERTESGLASKVLEAGEGDEHPGANNRVRVHFTGWTTDGEMFDTSTALGEPATLPPLERIVPGMREGLEMMVVGEKRRLWIPEALGFGGRPGAPEGMVVFDLELVEILPPQPTQMPGMPGMPPGAGGQPPQGRPGMPPSGAPPPGHPPAPSSGGGQPTR